LPDKKTKTKLPTLEDKQQKGRVFILLKLMRRARNPRLLGALVLYLAVCGVLLPRFFGGFSYREGDIAASDIESPASLEYVDKAATDAEREKAASTAGTVFRLEPTFRKDIERIFSQLLDYQQNNAQAQDRVRLENSFSAYGLGEATVRTLLGLKKDQPVQLRLKAYAVIEKLSKDGLIDEKHLLKIDDDTAQYARSEEIEPSLIPAVQDIIRTATKLNLKSDRTATEFLMRQAMDSVVPVKKRIKEKEMVVRKGEKVTLEHIAIMRELGLLKSSLSWARVFGYALLIALSFFVVAIYMKTFTLRIYRDEKRLLIFFMIVLLAVLWAVMIVQSPIFSNYLIGVSAGMMTILTCLLLNPAAAMFATPVLILVVSAVLGLETGHFLVALFAFLAAYFHSVRTQDRDSLLKAGIAISASSMIIILVMTMVHFAGIKQALMDVLFYGGLMGFLSFVLAYGLQPAFERLFKVTTPHRLLELSNPEEPLLKRLLIEAPGTYHHSILVGNLAESAAEAVGADALLVRIACYYHDVGKLKRPYFFIENQLQGVSQLSEMAPTLAALVISSHVKDGVEMAQESGIPDEVIEVIAEHHGTCLISFFYQQAQVEAKDSAGLHEERFRYPGPKPTRIEAAIMMLADSCEAAIRSQKAPTPKSIESTVNAIFDTRLVDGQFDDCNVTLRQLGEIKMSIMKTLARVYHSRMEYPDLEELKQHREHAAHKNGDH
jgi:cyclic-di-AMP phosphodiesterase PgpH